MTAQEQALGTALSMESITKRFPGTLAVNGVDFSVGVGEVHALMGENGAGKSTLMKVLGGSFNDYEGTIRIGGQPARIQSPADAKACGVGMVYQELSLARPVSIAENVLAGRLPIKGWGLLDHEALWREARHCLARVGLEVDPRKTVEEISPHEAQLVEIAKVLGSHPCLLVLDEPTSALSREEVQRLFAIVRELKQSGLSIIYISHHLPEIFAIADRVTVLRDGRLIGTHAIADVTPQQLVQMMVGQGIDEFYRQHRTHAGEEVLRVHRLTRIGFFHDVSFALRRGEILGLAGLSGAGRTECARSLCGLDPMDGGHITLDGENMAGHRYPEATAKGLVYLSEDRKEEGLFLRLSVAWNCMAACRLAPEKQDPAIRGYMDELAIAASSPAAEVGSLSGGNQQKVLLAKWLATRPRVLILDEPTRGVDVKAKRAIHESILRLADAGTAVLLISSDLPELVGLAGRALVMRNGRIIGAMAKEDLSEESVLLAANGEGSLRDA